MRADYIDHMGDDLRVVNSARVSFDKESEAVPPYTHHSGDTLTIAERDIKLVGYLARNGHWTPFAHPQITIRETVPIFVARQRFKHMIGFTYNEVSRRYVDDAPEFFDPGVWRSRPDGSVKQGSGGPHKHSRAWSRYYDQVVSDAKQLYTEMVEDGVAPEQARMILPQSMYTSYYVTGSLAAWARAFKQRIDVHAQQEIQTMARYWADIIEPLFPVSWDALTL